MISVNFKSDLTRTLEIYVHVKVKVCGFEDRVQVVPGLKLISNATGRHVVFGLRCWPIRDRAIDITNGTCLSDTSLDSLSTVALTMQGF